MIQVGDKVMLTFGNCPERVRYIGEISVVDEMRHSCQSLCSHCGAVSPLGPHACLTMRGLTCVVPIAWLRKLDDPDVAETREREELVDA